MSFEILKVYVANIQAAIAALESEESIPESDWQFVDCFLSSLKSDIVHAADTSSTLPNTMNNESKYLYRRQLRWN